jgi:ADP-ribosyl-[dinitrogen reductase] hydrolase
MNLRGGGSNHRDQHGKGDRLVDSQADGQHFVSLGEHSDHHKVLSDELRCRTPISAGDGVAPAVNASRFAAISWSQERQTTMDDRFDDKRRGGAYGLFIGDALAMPVHWYYNRHRLATDYGRVTDYLAPRNPHPDSILWRSRYVAANPLGEILHAQARYWGQREIHYHQFLKAGENTLNLKICRLLIDSLNHLGHYDSSDFLKRYIAFMTTPGSHNDTYIEECHRNFFSNYSRGRPPHRCGQVEKHIGGIGGIIPLVLFHHDAPDLARQTALTHLALTHPGPKMAAAAAVVISILGELFNGATLYDAIIEQAGGGRHALLGHPFTKWLKDPDDWVIGRRFSTACYVEDAIPAVVYLALKYHDDPEAALIANTNLGGDNAGRGAVLGALLGASHGLSGFPGRWVKGLHHPPPDLHAGSSG